MVNPPSSYQTCTCINRFSTGPTTPGVSAGSQLRSAPRLVTELPPPSQLDIDWSPVLTKRDERILRLGNLFVTHHPPRHPLGGKGNDSMAEPPKKFARFFSSNTVKKRQRLVMITSSARILMCASGTNDKKLKEDISLLSPGCEWKSFQDSRGLTAWCVETVSGMTTSTQLYSDDAVARQAVCFRRPQEHDQRSRREQVLYPGVAR